MVLLQLFVRLGDVVQGGVPRWASQGGLVEAGRPRVGGEGEGLQGSEQVAEEGADASANGTMTGRGD